MSWLEKKVTELTDTVTVEAEKTRAELADTFASSLRGARLDGALSRPLRPNATNYGTAGRLVGWSLRASAGDATITFRDGLGADDDPIATAVIPADTSTTVGLPGSGVSFVSTLWVEVTGAGAAGVVGAVWIGAVD